MVSKTKRAAALVLTAMIAASALAGCSGGGGSSSKTTTSGSTSGTTSGSSAAEVSAVDLDSAEMKKNITDAIKKEANGGVIKLKVWCSGDDLQFEKSRIEKFKEKYKDAGVEFKITPVGVGEDSAGGKIKESPKDGADVFSFADDQLSVLVEAKAIAKVGDIFQGNVVAENTKDSVEVCSSGGTPYAFPKTSDNGYFLYYDKRIFKDESEVANMDDMIKKANENGKQVYLNITNGWYNAGFYFAAGVKIEYKDGKQTTTFDSPEGVKAVKAMCHLAESEDKGFIGTGGSAGDNPTVSQGFNEQKFAAAVIGTWMGPAIKKAIGEENVGAAKLPTVLMDGKQEQLHSFGGYKIIGVNAFTKCPVTSQALAYFLGSPDSQIERYKERGLIPTSNKALEDEKVKADPALKAIEAQKPYAHAQGQSVGGVYWASNVGGFGGEIVAAKGKMDDAKIKKSLADLQTQTNK